MRWKRLSLIMTLLLPAVLVAGLGWRIYATVRQERLNRALIAAIKQKQTKTALALLDAGADPNSPDKGSLYRSPWQLLMDKLHGKDPANLFLYVPDDSALQVAVKGKVGFLSGQKEFFDDPALVQALLDRGANVNVRDLDDATPLINAVRLGRVQTVRLLLSHHADPNITYGNGITPLALAREKGDQKLVQMLKQAGAKE